MRRAARNGLARAWRVDSARASLERWQETCAAAGWGDVPEHLDELVRVFGASWYFTRLLFYRGPAGAAIIDAREIPDCTPAHLDARFEQSVADLDEAHALEALREVKNDVMLGLLRAWLLEEMSLAVLEGALSRLAVALLRALARLFGLEGGQAGFAILGMGRLAGEEMIFGSDLDLIFLYGGRDATETAALYTNVRKLLRHVAAVTPAGLLYEVDMRLRPHGTAGPLVTSADAFVDYHRQDREIWERQMMTRCRPVFDPASLAGESMERIAASLYGRYRDPDLREAIASMRMRVERELGSPRDKFEIKRGPGGVMDVDFLCHYLQLLHGHDEPALRTCSTRHALDTLESMGRLEAPAAARLRTGYDYLKRVECCLRLFDMKSISTVSRDDRDLSVLARAMIGPDASPRDFSRELLEVCADVRAVFNSVLQSGD